MDIQELLVEKIRNADRAAASVLLEAWAAEHGAERLVVEVLEPTLRLVGQGWNSTGAFSLAQGYVAAKVAEDALTKIAAQSGTVASASKGPVVIGNIEEDFHALGRRMIGTFLRAEGWDVHDLGNDVTAEAFVDCAVKTGARVIGASAMMVSTARNIRRLRDEIDRRGLAGQIQLAVGGAVFIVRPDTVEEVGGDGTASNPIEAVRLFDRLWRQSAESGTNA